MIVYLYVGMPLNVSNFKTKLSIPLSRLYSQNKKSLTPKSETFILFG